MKCVLLILLFSLSGCLSVPKQYIGQYGLGDEILTITDRSLTVSQDGKTLVTCQQAFQADSLFDAAVKGLSGLYVVPHYYVTDGHVTEDGWFLTDYPVSEQFDGSYLDEEGLVAHVVRSNNLVDVNCFNPYGSPVFKDHTYQTKGYSFAFQVDLSVDRTVQFVSVEEDSSSELDAVEEDSDYQVPFEGFKGSYSSFKMVPNPPVQFNRVGNF